MKVIIDERETELYEKCYSIVNMEGNVTPIQLLKEVLPLGDILIKTDEDKDVLLVERKTFQDLFASIKDGRYEEQSYRLIHSSGFPTHNIMYLLEGMFSQLKSNNEKKLIYSTITSLNYFKGFSVMRTASIRETAEYIIWMACKIDRDFIKGKIPSHLVRNEQLLYEPLNENICNKPIDNYCSVVKKVKKDNVTKDNIGEIILCQIPGISSITAVTIMKKFESFSDFINNIKENPSCLDGITVETNGKTRKINKTCIENIKHFLL
jgi:ERCC4-type nuclease